GPDPDAVTSAADLHNCFKDWCENQGAQAWSRRRFSSEMAARGLSQNRRNHGNVYIGLSLG
ncbi:hypothetical protein, partial [Pararhodobacter sp. SW119]|uniref:hypothetical protein n=1 Tax=Pararhodobacter sp. SW119 TaxID=2780075 RepID=UPI001ADFC50B